MGCIYSRSRKTNSTTEILKELRTAAIRAQKRLMRNDNIKHKLRHQLERTMEEVREFISHVPGNLLVYEGPSGEHWVDTIDLARFTEEAARLMALLEETNSTAGPSYILSDGLVL